MGTPAHRIRTVIADDEALARSYLRLLLGSDPDIEIVAECRDGIETLAAVEKHRPHLLLLDVQMPRLDGFGVLERLPDGRRPVVVFVTAYDHFALKAIQAHAVEYVVKPFDAERLAAAVDYGKSIIEDEARLAQLEEELRHLTEAVRSNSLPLSSADGNWRAASDNRPSRTREYLKRLVVRDPGSCVLVNTDAVEWIKSIAPYVEIKTKTKTHLLRQKMNWLEECLDPNVFVRIHRSYIVRINRIKELRMTSGGDYEAVLDDGTLLPLSRRRRETVLRAMGIS